MVTITTKEQDFYDALRDVFVGAEIEGESGYINLMRIKSRYFREKVFPQLQQDIAAVLDKYPDFRNELFDKLYDFFHRYFSESGSIYFRRTRYSQSIYDQVYTDDKDVVLFWKTRMLYYVKTDRLFKSMAVELEGHSFFFDVSELEHKQANERRDLVYRFAQVRADGTIVFQVEYSGYGSKTKMLDILRALRGEDVDVGEDILDRTFRVFEKQSEVDYFINKDAEKFLKEQFDLWMYHYVFQGQNIWLQRRLEQLQALKAIAYKIIDFIAQFEDELVRVWNKPKFVRNSHYVITLDRIAERDTGLLDRLLAHEGIVVQVTEWRELGMVGEGFQLHAVWKRGLSRKELNETYQYLPLDTRHFPDLQLEIVGLFDHLDEALDGWLIKSENYQALNTLWPRFQEQVKCIYIDPPYNTSASPIMYKNNYRSSTWTTLLKDRLEISKRFLTELGVLCVTIDDCQYKELRYLLEDAFGRDNLAGTVVIRANPSGLPTQTGFALAHEYAIFALNDEEAVIQKLERTEKQKERYTESDDIGIFEWRNFRREGSNSDRDRRRRLYYPIYVTETSVRIPELEWNESSEEWIPQSSPRENELVVFPIDSDGVEKTWRWQHDRVRSELSLFTARRNQSGELNIYYKYRPNPEGIVPPTIWTNPKYSATEHGTGVIKDLFGEKVFSYPKSVYAVEDCISIAGLRNPHGMVLDFFAGSGTTAHAVMNLNREDGGRRKYILVEMADYFDDVLLPRVKKMAFCDSWKDGQAQEGGKGMSHFVKYYQLEQYEDVLRKANYVEDALPFDNPYEDPYQQYVFIADRKMLDALEIDHDQNAVHVGLSELYDDIDLAETLANLRGKWIARITSEYVQFEDGERIDLQNLNWQLTKPLIWW